MMMLNRGGSILLYGPRPSGKNILLSMGGGGNIKSIDPQPAHSSDQQWGMLKHARIYSVHAQHGRDLADAGVELSSNLAA